MFHYFFIDTSPYQTTKKQMNDVNILLLTWEIPTLLWMFNSLMRAGETRNSLNACLYIICHNSSFRPHMSRPLLLVLIQGLLSLTQLLNPTSVD